MKPRDYTRLLTELSAEYEKRFPTSASLHKRAVLSMVDGGSHAVRLMQPFPPRIVSAHGAWLTDEDGHAILDYWQGHMANILGHNPDVITSALSRALAEGFGLQSGFTDKLQIEVAELLCQRTGGERARLTTSGTLATMYAIMLARAFTGRNLVLKVGGGWHGAQPWGLKAVSFRAGAQGGFDHMDSEGLPAVVDAETLVTRFNDPDMLRDNFRRHGDHIACFITEPFMGGGGFIPSTLDYLRTAREVTQQYGALLILDEIIAGFRFRAGDTGALFGVKPDLAAFGKIIGGGMPVAAVVGRADVMALVGRAGGSRVRFSGGTYCAHPASMLAAKTMMSYLVEYEQEVYPRLAYLGQETRRAVETAFAEEGIHARCTGAGQVVLRDSSMVMVHFPNSEGLALDAPDVVLNPALCDTTLSHSVVPVALLLEGVHFMNGHGAASTAHTEGDIGHLRQACQSVARRIKRYV